MFPQKSVSVSHAAPWWPAGESKSKQPEATMTAETKIQIESDPTMSEALQHFPFAALQRFLDSIYHDLHAASAAKAGPTRQRGTPSSSSRRKPSLIRCIGQSTRKPFAKGEDGAATP
jgi:hypothetical protein